MAKRLGRSFGKKQGKDQDIYAAEAAYVMVEIARDQQQEQTIFDMHRLIRQVYKGLYNYFYQDRVVSASPSTVRRYRKLGKKLPTIEESGEHLEDRRSSEADWLDMLEDVCRTPREREYVQLTMEGESHTTIAERLGICVRSTDVLRATIAKRLRSDYVSTLPGFREISIGVRHQEAWETTNRSIGSGESPIGLHRNTA